MRAYCVADGFSTLCPPATYKIEGHCARGQSVEKPHGKPLEDRFEDPVMNTKTRQQVARTQ